MSRGQSKGPSRERKRGFSLLETLVSVAIFSTVSIAILQLYTTMQTTMSRGELKTDLQQNARVGLDRMVQEIRMAGYDPNGFIPQVTTPPKAPIRAASSGCFSFLADVSGTGTDQITYDFDATGKTLRRRGDNWNLGTKDFSGGSAQPQAESVNLLTFTYYDAYNRVLTPASWTSTHRCPLVAGAPAQPVVQLDYWQMLQIRRVAIVLRTQNSRPGLFSEFYTLTGDVRLRNK